MKPSVSIVIPIFNEEEILEERIAYLIPELRKEFQNVEIVLSENGSVDRTKEIASHLASSCDEVSAVIGDEIADYGQALLDGINSSKYNEVSILELDYLDLAFLKSSYDLLSEYDLIIGSKKLSPGIDQRAWKRRLFTSLYNLLLRKMFHLRLTETHGLKTFRKSKLNVITNNCVSRHAVYPSEFVIRACRDEKLKVCEIPLSLPLREIRRTRINATRRFKKTLDDLVLLRRALKN